MEYQSHHAPEATRETSLQISPLACLFKLKHFDFLLLLLHTHNHHHHQQKSYQPTARSLKKLTQTPYLSLLTINSQRIQITLLQ